MASMNWRFKAGVVAMALAVPLPILALMVPLLGLPVAQSALLAGGLVAGAPEVLCLLAVALLGKENFNLLRSSAKSALLAAFLRPASKSRYYFALVLNLLTWLPLLLYAYLPTWMPKARIPILAGSDIIFILTLFFLGGEFWGKFQRLFIWEDRS